MKTDDTQTPAIEAFNLTKVYGEFMKMAATENDKAGAVKFKNAALGFRSRLREQAASNTVDMKD